MTMNTRQAGAFTELIKKEEAARERWYATHGAAYAARNAARTQAAQQAQAQAATTGVEAGLGATMPAAASSTASFNGGATNGFGATYSNGFGATFGSSRPGSARRDLPLSATTVGEPRLADPSDPDFTHPATVQKKVLRVVEVPVQRTVVDTRLVEQEELHTYALQPVPTGRVQVLAARDLGYTGRRLEQEPAAYEPASQRSTSSRAGSRPSSAQPRGSGTPSLSATGDSARLGFKVRTSSTNPGTCVVFDVEAGALAARSGLRVGDVILSTNGRQTASLLDFKNAIMQSRGPLLLQVRRGTDRFVITLHR